MEQINKHTFLHTFGGYILITILVVWLYLLWNENQSLKSTLFQVTNQLNIENKNNQKLQEIITKDRQKQSNKKINENNNSYTIKEKEQIKQKDIKLNQKPIVIVFPKDEKNYSKIIPKIEYQSIPLEKDSTKENQLKITPEVFIDKDKNTINGGKIQIEKKF